MIHIAIVEDEEKEIEQISTLLRCYFEEKNEAVDIVVFHDGSELIHHYPQELDLICLDIEMKQMNGLECAHKIRQQDTDVILLFITNMVQYATEGYAVDAIDFVVKPVQYLFFKDRLERIFNRLQEKKKQIIDIRFKKETLYLNVHDIVYIETDGKRNIIHLKSHDQLCSQSMQSLERKLQEYSFFRCHTAYLINLKWIETVGPKSVIIQGKVLPVSKYRSKELIKRITNYVGERL